MSKFGQFYTLLDLRKTEKWFLECRLCVCLYVYVVTNLVTRHGVWIGNWIYFLLENRDYN
jgi:hypothetical protein